MDNIAYFAELSDQFAKDPNGFKVSTIVQGYKNGVYSIPIDIVASDDFDKIISYVESNPSLMELEIINVSKTDSGTHGFCVKDSDNNVTVIYSGDYSYSDSWVDNFVGAVQEDSTEQENALTFFEESMEIAKSMGEVSNVTVSGHSKGGNLAQYVTIRSDDVDYCLSYDGQGFSDVFMEKYAPQIAANGSKITSISANYDFVHCVLNPIPNAQHYYVDVEMIPDELSARSLAWFHMPILILDENGYILPFTEQSEFSKTLHVISNVMVDIGDDDLDNMKSVLENIGTVIQNVFDKKGADEILPYIFNDEMKQFTLQILPAVVADGSISGGLAITELISDEGLRFVLENSSEEVLEYFFGENIADATTDMTVDITGVFTALEEYAILGAYYLLFGNLHNELTGDTDGSFFNEMFDVIGDNLSYHLENLLSSWYEGAEMISEFFGNSLDSFMDWCGDIWSGVTGWFADTFAWSDDGVIIGSDDDENLEGTDNDNIIYGNGGNDVIEGKGGNDIIFGDDGNDTLNGGTGDDELFGGEDNDTLNGDDGADKLFGGVGNDTLNGGEDNDELFGEAGNDTLNGDAGTDKLFGDDGNDTLNGGADDDELFGGEGDDTLHGDDGNDYIEGGNGNNYLYGDAGDDTIVTGEDTDHAFGGSGNDYVIGGNGANYMYGEDGDDRLQGGEGYDYMKGGLGVDNLSGGNGYNEMYGQEGNDFIYGGDHADYIDGGVGDDQLYGANATDGQNEIYGREGNDIIYDGDQGAYIEGNEGDDTIRAGGGNDIIDGGTGNDYIQDDHGDDTVVFKAGYGTDTISDAAGNNTLSLSGLSIENATAYKEGNDLKLAFDTGDNLIIKQYFDGAAFQNFSVDGVLLGNLINGYNGTENDDWMSAPNTNNTTLYGNGGNDTLNGGDNADTLDGGEGTDYLYGGNGDDTYIFGKGYGSDTIEDWNGSSIVKLTDINIDEVSISNANDSALVLTVDGTGDTLTINGYKWNQGGYTFEFADGTTDTVDKDAWTWESELGSSSDDTTGDSGTGDTTTDTPNTDDETTQPDVDTTEEYTVNGMANAEWLNAPNNNSGVIDAGGGDDGLNGGSGSDRLYGGAGNDNLYGNDGDDVLDGGADADSLNGGNGTDTYIFAKGYGNDTVNEWSNDVTVIKLTDIRSDEITLNSQSENNLVISINGTSDTLTISNYRWSQGSFTFEFADGAVATVIKETWELEYSQNPTVVMEETSAEASEDEIAQANAELLTELYAEDTLSTELISETDNTIISDVTESTTVSDETNEVSDQTDLQVMVLTENMSAFADEENISDGTNITDVMTEDTTSQLLVNSVI